MPAAAKEIRLASVVITVCTAVMRPSGVGSENVSDGREIEESSRAIDPVGPKSATKSLMPC